jgi:hypothetical protein
MAKIHILSETWDWTSNISSGYLSEKTYGLILAGVPFISLHTYPLEMVQKILNIREHPFYEDTKIYKNNHKLFIEFIEKFMNNFEENHILCKEWTNECNLKLMNLVNNNNSFLDLLQCDNLKILNSTTPEKFKKFI